MDDAVCDNCSTPLPPGSKYCSTCGTPVPDAEGGAQQSVGNGFPTDLRHALQMATQGEYEMHHELGRGGMGRVFLAREISLDRLVALKVLPPSLMFDEKLVERFKREARLVAQLHHPNIISIFRVYHSHNLIYYTMHYVPGRTLGQVMRTSPVLPLPEVERVLTEAADGLSYAHKRGVVHRDVKPGNILLDGERHIHLTDFGIAKALSQTTQLTDTGAVIGTPQYMAPEQYEGKEVDGRADQYSLAVVGYQLLVGHCPFESESMKQLLYQHLFTPPRPVNTIRPETPMPLRDAIHKALSKDPSDRFDSMEDFKAAIEGKGPPIFVSWIDAPPSGPGALRPDSSGGDMSTTHRLGGAPQVAGANLPAVIASDSQWGVPTLTRVPPHRKAMALLAVAVLVLGATAILTLASGDGLRGLLEGGGSDSGAGLQSAGPATSEAGLLTLGSHADDNEAESDEPVTIDEPVDSDKITLDGASSSAGKPVAAAVVPVATTRPRLRPRPLVPAGLSTELQNMLREGNVLREASLYFEAVETYRSVIERVNAETPRAFRDGERLLGFGQQALDGIETARKACELEMEVGAQSSCPS